MATAAEERALRAAISALAKLGLAEAAGWRPAERSALVRLGRAGLQRGHWVAACELLEYATLLDPDRAETWELVAGARMAGRRWDDALAALEVAWTLERSWRRAALAALCCARRGAAAEAKRWCEAARALAPAEADELRRLERALSSAEEGLS
ncbi:MAG: hypothetical protein JXB32_17430 [Deltaproteobacteria bacterium]|nr:hypothetical protein [Deltaproteobacteria bacterium]